MILNLLNLLRRSLRWPIKERSAALYDGRVTRPDGGPVICPKCGSQDVTLMLTEWIIGHQVENNGRLAFCNICKACEHRWEREPYF
jgi:hypothetical protein